MKLLRLFSGGGDLGKSDLSADGRLAELNASDLAQRPVAERNGLLAVWLAEVLNDPAEVVASELPRLFGLSMRRPRFRNRVRQAFQSRDLSEVLSEFFEAEVRAGATLIEVGSTLAQRRYLGDVYAGVSVERAAHVALRAQRLLAFGRRLLHTAIQSAIANELEGLTPLAPVGPIRLQAESILNTLRRLPPDVRHPNPPSRAAEQHLRDRGAELMLGADVEPRFIGTYDIHGQAEPHFVLGFEHPARDPDDLQRIARQTPDWLAELGVITSPVLILLLSGSRVRRLQRTPGATAIPDLTGSVRDALAFIAGRDLDIPVQELLDVH